MLCLDFCMFELIGKLSSHFRAHFKEFIPKTFSLFKEGYSLKTFYQDLFAGIGVGIIALPLGLAFAIASGVSPEKGLFTTIVAGFLISLLGGSRVQIGGPTGAFVVVIYSIVERHGYEGLALATLVAASLLLLMGIFRLGVLLKFIPYPVITGFTAGIALTIFSSQIKDFFDMNIDELPIEFIDKWKIYFQNCLTCSPWAVAIGTLSLISIFTLRAYFPKWPFVIVTLGLITLLVQLFSFPVETIGSKFGSIPNMLPSPTLPAWDYEKLVVIFPDALTIAFLGAIESLLSCAIADGMAGFSHRSNCELVAQGIGNIGSILFGGIPATGAIARTGANVEMGAKTPVAGMIHALTVFLMMIAFAPFVVMIPMPALAAILIYIAWNMSDIENCIKICKRSVSESAVLLTTFLLTILIDITAAVFGGVVLSVLLKKGVSFRRVKKTG